MHEPFNLDGYDIFSLEAIRDLIFHLKKQALRGVPMFWMSFRDLEQGVHEAIHKEMREYEAEEMSMRGEL